MLPISVGFWVKILRTRVPFSTDFPKHWRDFQKIGNILSKMGSFLPKFMIKVGMTATVGN